LSQHGGGVKLFEFEQDDFRQPQPETGSSVEVAMRARIRRRMNMWRSVFAVTAGEVGGRFIRCRLKPVFPSPPAYPVSAATTVRFAHPMYNSRATGQPRHTMLERFLTDSFIPRETVTIPPFSPISESGKPLRVTTAARI
jgi:hypothetical protein